MARPKRPTKAPAAIAGSASVLNQRQRRTDPTSERNELCKPWQREVYRHVNICGEARYAATLFSSIAGRAEIGVSEPQTLVGKPKWVTEGAEVAAFAALAPTVRERSKLIRDYMLHYQIAGESYLISRPRVDTDPPGYFPDEDTVWEFVAVTEIRKKGSGEHATWEVRHDNQTWIELRQDDAVIRVWNPDPENRQEAWSPFRSLIPTLREIEYFTQHIFVQVRSRLMSAGVWFLPNNMTFPAPPPDAVQGGASAIANMNEAEQFMVSLATSSMSLLDAEEVAFPTVVLADPDALAQVDQRKLIQFWSEIDDAAMMLRSDAVRRFALGMDLPPEQVLGSSGLAVTGAGGSAGSVNHWGVWANEEQTISAHVEPALDVFVGTLTSSYLRSAVEGTEKVIAYDTASLRLRQDRSKEAIELWDRGLIKAEVVLRENGYDPAMDKMDDSEFRKWLLAKVAGGSATPEQVNEALKHLGVVLNVQVSGNGEDAAPRHSDRNGPRNLDGHPYEGPPRVDHEHNDAPYSTLLPAAEVLVLRALEKAGNLLLNDRKRGKDHDRTTPKHLAHLTLASDAAIEAVDFDFSLLPVVFSDLSATRQRDIEARLRRYCRNLYTSRTPHRREVLAATLKGA